MSNIQEDSKKLIDALEDAYIGSVRSYSGRGMFGKSCVAISGDEDVSEWNVAKHLFSEEYDGAFDRLPAPHHDQLGRGIVLYWPTYPWPEGKH